MSNIVLKVIFAISFIVALLGICAGFILSDLIILSVGILAVVAAVLSFLELRKNRYNPFH
jgi:predicted Co/Zn/Cd cation transporter (cation efflux family)